MFTFLMKLAEEIGKERHLAKVESEKPAMWMHECDLQETLYRREVVGLSEPEPLEQWAKRMAAKFDASCK